MTGAAVFILSVLHIPVPVAGSCSHPTGGALAAITIGLFPAMIINFVALIFQMPMLSLAVSAMFVIAMAGLILYQTSAIVNGGETNYIMATVTLYVSIYNLFTSLLHLLGVFGDE